MFTITIQHATDKSLAPSVLLLRKWATAALRSKVKSADVTIRLVAKKEMALLNATYRHKNKPTNVLSFPFAAPAKLTLPKRMLGDIVICSTVVNAEAKEQDKPVKAHWAHMVVHGIYHLLGYDHETAKDAKVMETLEIKTMRALGFANPYVPGENE
jgi:probable rRNA maturation factor